MLCVASVVLYVAMLMPLGCRVYTLRVASCMLYIVCCMMSDVRCALRVVCCMMYGVMCDVHCVLYDV